MSLSRRALLGLVAGLPLALKAGALEPKEETVYFLYIPREYVDRIRPYSIPHFIMSNPPSDTHWLAR